MAHLDMHRNTAPAQQEYRNNARPLGNVTSVHAECSARTAHGTLWRHYGKPINYGICSGVLAGLLSLGAKVAPAQAVTGTLLGTVQDSSGAVVPGANIMLINEGTNVSNRTTAGPQGFYTFPNLNPGLYSVTIDAKGFRTLTSKHNEVLVEESTRVDLTLSPGAVSEQVTVTGITPLVETTTSDLGTTIDSTQINNLPINGRNPAMLMQLAPGSTPAAWGAGNGEDSSTASTTAPGGGGGGAYTSTNGFPFESNLYLVDGVTDVELENAYQGLQIPFDFIGELKLETSDPDAEYGSFGAQVSNITTKSGTNTFHGQVFEYNRNTDFNEPDHFSQTNPPFHYNQFGGEVDGPIFKNKLFFTADLQWLKLAEGSSGVVSLPTAAARSGDLSGFDEEWCRSDHQRGSLPDQRRGQRTRRSSALHGKFGGYGCRNLRYGSRGGHRSHRGELSQFLGVAVAQPVRADEQCHPGGIEQCIRTAGRRARRLGVLAKRPFLRPLRV